MAAPPPPFLPDESVPPFFVTAVTDSVSESLTHDVTVMTGGGAGRSSVIGFPTSPSIIFRAAVSLSLCGGGDPGNSALGELTGVGCCTISVGMVSRLHCPVSPNGGRGGACVYAKSHLSLLERNNIERSSNLLDLGIVKTTERGSSGRDRRRRR